MNFYCQQIRSWRRLLWNRPELPGEQYLEGKIAGWKRLARTLDGFNLDLI